MECHNEVVDIAKEVCENVQKAKKSPRKQASFFL